MPVLKRYSLCLVSLILLVSNAFAQTPFHLIPGSVDSTACQPLSPARICLGSTETDRCYTPPGSKENIFALDPAANQIGSVDGNPLIIFKADFSRCGNGLLSDYSLLTLRNGQWINLLPTIRLSDQSQHNLWNLPNISPQPILVTADFIWNMDRHETREGLHNYLIQAFVYDPAKGHYKEALRYTTSKRYPGTDLADAPGILAMEKPVLLKKLK